MKYLVIVSGLVMSMTMSAMNVGKTAEGAAPLEISDEVARMPDNPRKSPKKKASPQMRAEVQTYFSDDLKALREKFKAKELAKLKAMRDKINQ